MPAIDWTTTLASLDGALAGATGTDLAVGAPIRDALARSGAKYDARWSLAIDAAKLAWLASAEEAHNQADRVCIAAETAWYEADPNHGNALLEDHDTWPPPGSALAFDPWSLEALKGRAARAARLATTSPTRATLISTYLAAADARFTESASWGDPRYHYTRPDYDAGTRERLASMRAVELDLVRQIAAAAEWLSVL